MRHIRGSAAQRLTAPVLAALVLGGAAGAQAASLRAATMLHAPVVRLSDLFDDAGANANRVLGTAPGPGGSIVVEAPQLAAIARQFAVDWRPASPADRAVLERAGRLLPRRGVLKAMKAALVAAGASPQCEIEMPGFTPPMVPAEASPRPLATELNYDAGSGRFTAVLSVTGAGMDPINLRVAGQVNDTIALPVAVARLPAGTVLRADDVRVARVPVAMVHSEVLHTMSEAVGLQLRDPIAAGQPFAVTDVTRPSLVQRGTNVEMQLQSPGISLLAQGVAMDSGATGERIRVLNPSSRVVVEAEVIGPGRVRVTPETMPLATASRATERSVQ
ncbi:MAG TPA: flagellar basal body P-ring formation chaperone FlgA [Acetobacteraceae bacterium]|nr:flagellar basal body P-ring formation chaperone FlgA [Acetobacteraceae bacterium]